MQKMKMVFLPVALLFCLPRAYGNDNRRVIRGGRWDTEPYAARTYDQDAK